MTTDNLRAWAAITGTRGIGPRAVFRIATGLRSEGLQASDLLDRPFTEMVEKLATYGASAKSANALAESLSGPPVAPRAPVGVTVLHPDSEAYPFGRLHPRRPLPGLLYTKGATFLLSQPSIAIVGSRDTASDDVDLAQQVAAELANRGRNVVSGHARGVDHAAHVGAVESGGTTTAVLAEGIERFQPREGVVGDAHSFLVVSQFPPDARWQGHQAMARNATMAALSDAVIVIRSGETGGTREMIRLCSRTELPTVAVDGRVPDSLRGELTHIVGADPATVAQTALGALPEHTPPLF